MSLPDLPRAALDHDDLPLYVSVAARLRDDLVAAEAGPGDRLPSERVLTERYAVSRVTVRAALAELERLRVVRSAASRGWFVAERETPPASTTDHVEGFADWARARRLRVTARVLEHQVRPSTVVEAERLHLAPGAPLLDLRRLRSLDGLVVVLEHNQVPAERCPALADVDFTTASLYATLGAAEPPVVARVADYAVEARHATTAEAALLGIDEQVPVLVAEQLSYDDDRRPMEHTVQVYRGDRYRFRASITNR